MKIKKSVIFLGLVIALSVLVPFVQALAAGTSGPGGQTVTDTQTYVSLGNPLGNTNTPQQLIGKVISAVMALVGSLALLMFVYGGLLWMTSAGSADKVSKGKNILMWSAIGLIVIFSSYALVKFSLETIGAQ